MVYSFPHVRYNISANLRAAPAQNMANPVIDIMSNEETLCYEFYIIRYQTEYVFEANSTCCYTSCWRLFDIVSYKNMIRAACHLLKAIWVIYKFTFGQLLQTQSKVRKKSAFYTEVFTQEVVNTKFPQKWSNTSFVFRMLCCMFFALLCKKCRKEKLQHWSSFMIDKSRTFFWKSTSLLLCFILTM